MTVERAGEKITKIYKLGLRHRKNSGIGLTSVFKDEAQMFTRDTQVWPMNGLFYL